MTKTFGTLSFLLAFTCADPSHAAQWVARPDWTRATAPSRLLSVPYSGNDEVPPQDVRRVLVVRGPRQGLTQTPYVGDTTETAVLSYRQTNQNTSCRLDFLLYRIQGLDGRWSNDTLLRVLVEVPATCGACTFDEPFFDCDSDGRPDECDAPPPPRRVTSLRAAGGSAETPDAYGPRSEPALASGGRYLAVVSREQADPRDVDFLPDVYRIDLLSGERVLVSVSADGLSSANAACYSPTITGDGSIVAWESAATNLAADANGSESDVFLRDLSSLSPVTELISVRDDDMPPVSGASNRPSITEEGRYVAFDSTAALSIEALPTGVRQVFQRDRVDGTTRLMSALCDPQEVCTVPGNDDSYAPAVNARGRYTAFLTRATNLVAPDTNAVADVLVHDRNSGANLRVSTPNGGGQADAASFTPCIDGPGFRVAFSSRATNLVGPAQSSEQVYLAEISGSWPSVSSTLTLQSRDALGAAANQLARWPSLSFDGASLAYASAATNLAPADDCHEDVFVRDIGTGSTRKLSVSERGSSAGASSWLPALGADGSLVAFGCDAELDPRGNGYYVHAVNRALRLDGAGWLRVLDDPLLDLDSMTIELWVRPDDVGALQTLVSKWGDAGVDDRSYLVQLEPGGWVDWELSRADNQSSSNYHGFSTGRVNAGEWHHVACTYDGAVRRTYIDGVQVGQKGSVGPVHVGTTDLALGARLPQNAAAALAHFEGRIDELRVWSKALSQLDLRWALQRQITALERDFYPDLLAVFGFDLGLEDGLGRLSVVVEGEVDLVEAEEVPFLDFDCNANGYLDDIEIVTGLGADANGDGVLDSCQLAPTFCDASDGALASCPCANAGEPAGGCENAQGTGGVRAQVIAFDQAGHTAAIRAWGFPSAGEPASILIRSNVKEPAPVVFGDGIRCVGASGLVRLAATTASHGEALHLLNHNAGPGTFHYQAWYRNNPPAHCTPASFNLSNGWTLTW